MPIYPYRGAEGKGDRVCAEGSSPLDSIEVSPGVVFSFFWREKVSPVSLVAADFLVDLQTV